MLDLIDAAATFLEPQHFQSDPAHYTRNPVYAAPDDSLSLYALVWRPGQWTPVHDHGSWGGVGIVEGVIEERSYVRLSPDRVVGSGIDLVRGGVILLGRGAQQKLNRCRAGQSEIMGGTRHLTGLDQMSACVKFTLPARAPARPAPDVAPHARRCGH